MVMLSKLRRFDLFDASGRRAKFADLVVDLSAEDYPPVTRLLFREANKTQAALPWEAVRRIDWRARRIEVTDLNAGEVGSAESLTKEVLLRRDIQDALVLDLQNRRATRANDLWLEEEGGRLSLRAADTSSRAVLRRLSGGLLDLNLGGSLYDWKYVEFLRGDPQGARSGAGYNMRIGRLPPGEIARLTDALPYLHAAELLTLLPDPIAADTLEFMTPERQLQVFEELTDEQALRLLALLAPDIAADLAGRLQPQTAKGFLEKLPRARSDRIVELLRYPEDTVGGIMTNDFVFLSEGLTVAEGREALRERMKEPDFVYLIYIVADEESRQLRGVTGVRNLFIADDERKVEEIMDSYLSTLNPLEQAQAGAFRVINSHLAAMPVVGGDGKLLGVVTVDAAVSQVAPQSWKTQAPRVFS